MTVLETDRLILRPFTTVDFDAFAAMYADPRVAQFVTEDRKPLSRFAAWRAMAGIVGHWTLRGFGLFAVVERETGALVGRIGPWEPEGWPDFEIGWIHCVPSTGAAATPRRLSDKKAGPAKAGPYVRGGRAWRD